MWGIPVSVKIRYLYTGITPTYVGNTLNRNNLVGVLEDHPHVCGEYCKALTRTSSFKGSPPRMWGILIKNFCRSWILRITPTYVGNTLFLTQNQRIVRDHPHVCGEYYITARVAISVVGSPPRMWGIHCFIKRTV